jgi:hypothetical protein
MVMSGPQAQVPEIYKNLWKDQEWGELFSVEADARLGIGPSQACGLGPQCDFRHEVAFVYEE